MNKQKIKKRYNGEYLSSNDIATCDVFLNS